MVSVDWAYLRKACKSCEYASDYLSSRGIKILTQEDARKVPIPVESALALTEKASSLYVTRGKKVYVFDMKSNKPDDETLLSLIIGPSGKLRAPALMIGNVLIIGFDQGTYEIVFGDKS